MEDLILLELERISAKRDGELLPEDVVEAARPPRSPLHSRFTWDDSEAAHQYRLWQARQLIRVKVSYLKVGDDEIASRVFVSLSSDRCRDGGGYRTITSVMNNSVWRDQLLLDALEEMRRFKEKYATLKELAGVFEAMSSAERKRFCLVG